MACKFSVPSMETPYVVMHNPSGTRKLDVGLETQEYLLYSLMFDLHANPRTSFKPPKTNHRRKMAVSLAHNGELGLTRADQTVSYNIEWVSAEVQAQFLALRKRFIDECPTDPETASAFQSHMWQIFLEKAAVERAVIKQQWLKAGDPVATQPLGQPLAEDVAEASDRDDVSGNTSDPDGPSDGELAKKRWWADIVDETDENAEAALAAKWWWAMVRRRVKEMKEENSTNVHSS